MIGSGLLQVYSLKSEAVFLMRTWGGEENLARMQQNCVGQFLYPQMLHYYSRAVFLSWLVTFPHFPPAYRTYISTSGRKRGKKKKKVSVRMVESKNICSVTPSRLAGSERSQHILLKEIACVHKASYFGQRRTAPDSNNENEDTCRGVITQRSRGDSRAWHLYTGKCYHSFDFVFFFGAAKNPVFFLGC